MFRRTGFLLCLANLLPASLGFAAWLKCNRHLEEDEIIMNNKVKKAPTEEPMVKLAVFDTSGTRVDVPSEDNDGDTIVWIDPSDSSPSLSFVIGLDPDTVKKLADVQYVVESTPFDDSKQGSISEVKQGYPSPTPMTPTVPSPKSMTESSFIGASPGGGILCNGRRGHARGKKGSLKYELVTKKRSRPKEEDATITGEVDDGTLSEVVAGYSAYHGAVTLTPRILFKRKEKQTESSSNTAGQGEL
mmetsp:Transcript_10650/g.22900  ORF Transcript_10650/g.22900 Transcript_10650/m.22900 type:complete len:245 (-) Transcript_10650:350-1084(-)